MKAVRSVSPQEGIADVRKEFLKDDHHFQSMVRVSPSIIVGTAERSWGRGRQCGIHDAYLTIKTEHPDVANALLAAYGMNEDGAFTSRRVEVLEE